MFWRKKSDVPEDLGLQALATQLGLEKRFSPRVSYPPKTNAGLPSISFNGRPLRVHDLSVGGCSLIDPTEVFGPDVGQEVELRLTWTTGEDVVRARLVGRVDHRRNFQFLDLAPARAERIRGLIGPGVRGLDLRGSVAASRGGPNLEAIEFWTSLAGDSVTIESHLQRIASVYIQGKTISVLRDSWPLDERSQPISRTDFDALTLFLANIPQRSRALGEILFLLEELGHEVIP